MLYVCCPSHGLRVVPVQLVTQYGPQVALQLLLPLLDLVLDLCIVILPVVVGLINAGHIYEQKKSGNIYIAPG